MLLDVRGRGHALHRREQFQQMLASQLQGMFVGVHRSAEGKVFVGRVGHLDVCAEHVHHRLVGDEADQPFDALPVLREVRDVQAPGIQRLRRRRLDLTSISPTAYAGSLDALAISENGKRSASEGLRSIPLTKPCGAAA